MSGPVASLRRLPAMRAFFLALTLALAAWAVAPAMAIAQTRVPVQVEERASFSRLIFQWPMEVGLRISRDGPLATLRFDRPGEVDVEGVRRLLPPPVTGIFSSEVDGRLQVTLDLLPGQRLRHFRNGNALIVDILPATEQEDTTVSSPASAVGSEPAIGEPAAGEARPGTPLSPLDEAAADIAMSADSIDESEPTAAIPAPDALPPMVVAAEPSGNGLSLTFPFDRITTAAAFRRGDTLWLVFDQPSQLDLGALSALRPDLLTNGGQDFAAPATVLRLDQRGDRVMTPTLQRQGLDWIVDLQPGLRRDPATALEVIVEAQAQGARLFLPTGEVDPPLQTALQIQDPVAGDTLLVMPLRFPGYGVRGGRHYPQFALLPSLQGVVVKPWADAVQVRGVPNGVAVDVSTGLLLAAAERLLAPGAASSGEGMLQVRAWRRAGEAPFPEMQQQLLHAFSIAEEGQRLDRQRDLIRFMFAYDFAADALGLLAVYGDLQGGLADLDPELRAIRGISRLQMRRLDEASTDLDSPIFDQHPDVVLWRVPLAFARGQPDRAIEQYRAGLPALEGYPAETRSRFRLAAARAMLEVGAYRDALREVADMLKEDQPTRTERAWSYLVAAQAHAALDDLAAATADFERALDAGVMEVRVKALYAQAVIDFGNGDITRAQFIEQLDALRFAWRGGRFEYDLLRKLGELYLAEGRYREGLVTLRQTAVYFPERAAESAEVAGEMTRAFRQLFLEGAADRLEPLTALALYYDFRELTPTGEDGDEMIRKLADRLVGVDLLSQAAELMEHQVRFRLSGEERARVGARLAVIELLNRQPERALRALDESAMADLPQALEVERRQLRARALADLGRYVEALDPLSGLDDLRTAQLRAEINWRAKNWKATASALEPLADTLSRTEGPLVPEDRRRILQLAISLALEGENQKIAPLRERFLTRLSGTPEARAFGIITDSLQREATDIRQLTAAIAEVDQLEAFMADYRERLARGGLQAIN